MSKKISLKQFLMRTGKFEKVYSCIEAIKHGKVIIDNKTITNPNYFFNPKKSLVKFENRILKRMPKLYFIMNKPAGYLSQKSENEKTIYDLLKYLNLPKELVKSLFAVGRLDKETEGLIILTNDGELADIIARPEREIIKKYYAVLEKPIDPNKAKMLEKGVQISIGRETYKTRQCRIKIIGESQIYISISEGKKRQIRRMIEAIGNSISYLKRVSIGGLQLGNLNLGQIIEVSKEEIMDNLEP